MIYLLNHMSLRKLMDIKCHVQSISWSLVYSGVGNSMQFLVWAELQILLYQVLHDCTPEQCKLSCSTEHGLLPPGLDQLILINNSHPSSRSFGDLVNINKVSCVETFVINYVCLFLQNVECNERGQTESADNTTTKSSHTYIWREVQHIIFIL